MGKVGAPLSVTERSRTILVALPFAVVMPALCWALLRELRTDPGAGPSRHAAVHGLREAVGAAVGETAGEAVAEPSVRRTRP